MRQTFLTLLLLAAPRAALACPVCFGQNDSPLASAMNLGIFAMLAVTVGVLVAFASFFIHLVRRARMAADAGSVEAISRGPADAGPYAPDAQGGMV